MYKYRWQDFCKIQPLFCKFRVPIIQAIFVSPKILDMLKINIFWAVFKKPLSMRRCFLFGPYFVPFFNGQLLKFDILHVSNDPVFQAYFHIYKCLCNVCESTLPHFFSHCTRHITTTTTLFNLTPNRECFSSYTSKDYGYVKMGNDHACKIGDVCLQDWRWCEDTCSTLTYMQTNIHPYIHTNFLNYK